jgi:hypothetical protein
MNFFQTLKAYFADAPPPKVAEIKVLPHRIEREQEQEILSLMYNFRNMNLMQLRDALWTFKRLAMIKNVNNIPVFGADKTEEYVTVRDAPILAVDEFTDFIQHLNQYIQEMETAVNRPKEN